MNKNQINTIFFDLFGVLLGIDQSVVMQYLAKLTGASYLETKEIAMGDTFMCLERGEIDFIQYVKTMRSALPNGSRIDADILRDVWMSSRVGEMPAVSLLKNLQSVCEVWIISNTTGAHISRLKSTFSGRDLNEKHF